MVAVSGVRPPHPTDLRLLNLSLDPEGGHGRFELIWGLGRHDGALYGGTGIAVSVAAMEAATGREALWVTTQFAATAHLGSVIDVETQVLASGRAISQLLVTARHAGRTLFVSVGSTATPRPDGLDGQFETMPVVTAPEDSMPIVLGPTWMKDVGGLGANIEYRVARRPDAGAPAPTAAQVEATGQQVPMTLWARLTEGRPSTRAGIAFLADMIPPAIARAAGMLGGGPSLDNSLRFGRVGPDVTWVLLELWGHMAYGAHAHGAARVWSPDGDLLAVGSQTANMVHIVPMGDAGSGFDRLADPGPPAGSR